MLSGFPGSNGQACRPSSTPRWVIERLVHSPQYDLQYSRHSASSLSKIEKTMKLDYRHLFTMCALWLVTAIACASLQAGGAAYKAGRFEQAFKSFMSVARKGDPVAQYLVASMYEEGRGTSRSVTLAIQWYALAAAQDDIESQVALAQLYLSEEPTNGTNKKAIELLEKAAGRGHPQAANRLGAAYLNGTHVTKDPGKAARWFQQGADQGNLDAVFNLGRLYALGEGVQRSTDSAKRCYQSAAYAGHAPAQAQLGTALAEGRLGAKDLARSYAWLTLAAEQQMQIATSNLELVKKQLTAKQLASAAQELERIRAKLVTESSAKTENKRFACA